MRLEATRRRVACFLGIYIYFVPEEQCKSKLSFNTRRWLPPQWGRDIEARADRPEISATIPPCLILSLTHHDCLEFSHAWKREAPRA